jgi:GT2 family glycosyltransferase
MNQSDKTPKVSICVPNLNTRPFLPERFETIFNQTFQDWEIIVYDSFSDDGAWEYFQELAAREPRMRISQGPREGTPGSWNPCIRQARGDYVYVATSDDTMAPDCLAKLVAALERNPECDLSHCRLRVVGDRAEELQGWWEKYSLFARSCGSLLDQPHVRRAPFDGLLHLSGESLYTSITQLLIRRSLFDRIGYFEKTWGSVGDFEWDMRASLVGSTVHVPDTWGGWRIHGAQATAGVKSWSPEHVRKIDAMIGHALKTAAPHFTVESRALITADACHQAREKLRLFSGLRLRETRSSRWKFLMEELLKPSPAALSHLAGKFSGEIAWPVAVPGTVRGWFEHAGLGAPLRAGSAL